MSRVRPEDDLVGDLAGGVLDSLETVEILMEIEDCFGVTAQVGASTHT